MTDECPGQERPFEGEDDDEEDKDKQEYSRDL
jgi:hypothetical protein